MRFANALLLCLLLASFSSPTQAQLRTVPMGAEKSQLTLIQQDGHSYLYRVQVGDLTAMDVVTPEGSFARLMIPGFHASMREGAPELPMMNRLCEIPYGASARIEVISQTSRSVSLADYGITRPLFPAQPSMPKNADPATWPFAYDRDAYSAPRVAQSLVGMVDVGQLRSVHLGRIEVSPIEYFPAENRILVHDQIEFRVIFDGADQAAGDELKARTYSPYFDCLWNRIDGYRGIHDQYPDRVRDAVTMVIITPAQYSSYLTAFVNWKTTRGFHMIVGVIGTPEVGTTKESIQAYIRTLYNNPQAPYAAPSFVLFVGDVDTMPTWATTNGSSDRPYCAVDADLMPEMYYGRFSCANPTQLQAMLDKTLMYDQYTMPDPSYLSKVVMIAGVDASHGQVWANGQINYGTTYYFNTAHGINSFTHLYPASGSQEAQIISEVSGGVAYANYTAHGSETGWADPTFTQADVNGLQNSGKYCLAVGNCCLTSKFDYAECFAETWLRVANKGAIGYIGASNNSLWDEDYWWGVGYRAAIVERPTYDPAHMGAYDGVFHDHGEAMTQWYVANDALIFCGNLAVTESGSSNTTYYWNIYNLMGDPSISTYLGLPTANPVTHPSTVFTTWSSIDITAVPNSYVGLTKSGQLIGAGTTDAAGNLTLPIWASPLTPGPAHLVVMAQNRIPYQADLNVIVPAVVQLNPNTIDANVTTAVDVGVFEYDGITPKPGVEVWASGLQYESAHGTTDAGGHVTLSVTYSYGPSLDIVGKNPSDSWELFRVPLTVVAQPLTSPDLSVTTNIGLVDTLALNLPAVLHAQVTQPGHTLLAFLNGNLIGSTPNTTLDITPDAPGVVQGIIAVSGYDLYTEEFPVIEAYGTLFGHVDANGSPAAGAVVKGYDSGDQLVFQATANTSGNYTVADDILCASYTIKVDYFGFLHFEQTFFVNYGANVLNVALSPAPSGVITGVVTETGTGAPLEATIKVYRSDTMELYAQANTDPLTGAYTTPSLPYFTWVVTARASRHIPVTVNVTVDQPSVTRNFALTPTIGDILLIDNSGAKGSIPAKLDEKTGAQIEPGAVVGSGNGDGGSGGADGAKAATDIKNDLEALGYTVTVETVSSNPANWPSYDLLIVSCGNNTASLNATIKTALIGFVTAGGHLLIEGGEVGYTHRTDTAFCSAVLHVTGWAHDSSGNVTVAAPTHYLMSVPNTITGPIAMAYVNYGDEDAMTITSNAVMVGAWSTYPTNSSIVAYDPNPAPEGGQIAYYSFNYSAMDATKRPQLLQNTVIWLMTPEIGDCSVSGTAILSGQSDHSGIKVEAVPGGGFVYTDASGAYTLPNLFPGTYMVRASKTGWSTESQQETLVQGQQMTGCDFLLSAIEQVERCRTPNLPIPDNNPTGVTDNMTLQIGGTISGIEVYINITHPYIGDLIVKLRSPAGTWVTLHNRTGSSSDNIVGWYPSQIVPAQSLDAFLGQPADGVWQLNVSDNAASDVGTLNQWCLRVLHGAASSGVDGRKQPAELALYPVMPSPSAGAGAIRFDIPRRTVVDLAVFDVAGRRVAVLQSGILEAGVYSRTWLGRDDEGKAASNGVYFYRLRAEGHTLSRRMMLVK